MKIGHRIRLREILRYFNDQPYAGEEVDGIPLCMENLIKHDSRRLKDIKNLRFLDSDTIAWNTPVTLQV